MREKDLKKHLKGKASIGNIEQDNDSKSIDKDEEIAKAANDKDLLKDNQLQQAVSLLSGWEVMKKMFKNLKVTTPNSDNQFSMN